MKSVVFLFLFYMDIIIFLEVPLTPTHALTQIARDVSCYNTTISNITIFSLEHFITRDFFFRISFIGFLVWLLFHSFIFHSQKYTTHTYTHTDRTIEEFIDTHAKKPGIQTMDNFLLFVWKLFLWFFHNASTLLSGSYLNLKEYLIVGYFFLLDISFYFL